MAWDDFTWKIKIFLSKVNWRAIAVVLSLVIYGSAPFVAPILLGGRGDLLALAMQWFVMMLISGLVSLVLFLVFRAAQSGWKWAGLAGLAVFGSLFLYATFEEVRSAADFALPFKQRDVTIVSTYYEHPQTGRGALPETGGWHLVTSGGDDYVFRESGDGDEVKPGRYQLDVSYLKHLVMAAHSLGSR